MASKRFDQPLKNCEKLLINRDEYLMRACASGFFDPITGQASSEAFGIRRSDEGKLSVFRSSVLKHSDIFDYRSSQGLTCACILKVSVGQIDEMDLQAIDDSVCEPQVVLGHSFIDFRASSDPLSKAERETIRSKLLFSAISNGLIKPPLI